VYPWQQSFNQSTADTDDDRQYKAGGRRDEGGKLTFVDSKCVRLLVKTNQIYKEKITDCIVMSSGREYWQTRKQGKVTRGKQEMPSKENPMEAIYKKTGQGQIRRGDNRNEAQGRGAYCSRHMTQ